MPSLPAILTTVGAEKYAKYPAGLIPHVLFTHFRLGEGGWIATSAGRAPRTPIRDLTSLDIIEDVGRPAGSRFYDVGENLGYFEKVFVPGDFSYVFPGILKISSVILTTEYNFKNVGTLIYDVGGPYTSPEIWEIGLFDADDDMIIYGTFPRELKDATKQIENLVRLMYIPG